MTAPGGPVAFGERSRSQRSASFGRFGALLGCLLLVAVVGGLAFAALAGRSTPARHPRLFGGSLVLDDYRPLTVIDVATGQVTVRLDGVYQQVAAKSYAQVQAVRVRGGTMLINRTNGTFNLLGADDYVVDTSGGVGLGSLPGATGAAGLAAGSGVYIIRYGSTSTVSLVDAATVAQGARLTAADATHAPAVTPRGYANLHGQVTDRPSSAAVASGNLWVLVAAGAQSCQLHELQPTTGAGQGLRNTVRLRLPGSCAAATLEAADGAIGVATPGEVRVFAASGGPSRTVAAPGSELASTMVPVQGPTGHLWYLARTNGGWSIFGVNPAGQATRLRRLPGLSASADPVSPAESDGKLYTLDQAAPGQPTLWVIDPDTAAMHPLAGVTHYPAKNATEKANFLGAEVLADGPRVVFNNPDSLLAVVVFTNGSHRPVVVDKSVAEEVSPTGPGNANVVSKPGKSRAKSQPKRPSSNSTPPTTTPAPQPVSQQVTCANTTQKPYAPQITDVTPSSESALVSWSYQLLDDTDCEPDSWAVRVIALHGTPQPAQPVQVVNGQSQLQFVGLRPSTTYEVIVTAYINKQSTPSAPTTFTTSAQAPGAPTSVHTVADGDGDWTVSWTPCTTGASCYESAARWTVIGRSCGSAFVGTPPSLQVAGGETSVVVNARARGLLGTSLSFSVEGVGSTGLIGNPTGDGSCTQAWAPPIASEIGLSAAGTPSGQSITATLQVHTSTVSADAYGTTDPVFTYSVGGHTVGPTTATAVTVPGLAPATSYSPSVTVYPSGHPSSSVTVNGSPFTQDIPWPSNLALQATGAASSSDPNVGTVTAQVLNLPAGTFNATGRLTCASVGQGVDGLVTGGRLTISNIDLVEMGGSCSLSLTLNSTTSPDPYGVASRALSASLTLGTEPTYGFTATCTAIACLQVQVAYAGSGTPAAGSDWVVTAQGQGNQQCQVWPAGSSSSSSPPSGDIPWPLLGCPRPTDSNIFVSWVYLGTRHVADAGTPSTPTTTTSTSSTTSTTAAPTTTSSSSTSSTTAAASSSGGAAALVASSRNDPPPSGGGLAPLVGILLAIGAAWCSLSVWGGRRRRRRPATNHPAIGHTLNRSPTMRSTPR